MTDALAIQARLTEELAAHAVTTLALRELLAASVAAPGRSSEYTLAAAAARRVLRRPNGNT
jgi:hypothetical protein